MNDGVWPYIAFLFKCAFESIANDYKKYTERMQALHKTDSSYLFSYILSVLMMPFVYLYEKLWGASTD